MQLKTTKEISLTKAGVLGHVWLTFSAMSTICILGWLLKYCHYGIEFTDESFYLVWMSNPFIYSWSATQFGFIYHPLYALLNGNVVLLRQANIFITFGLAWLLVYTFLKGLVLDGQFNKLQRLVVSAGFATVSLILFYLWLPSPSYNSLIFQSLLIAAIGLLLAEATPSCASITGWALIALSGWLAFMAKPTTALLLAFCAVLYLLFAKKMNLRLLFGAIGMAMALLVLGALAVDGSVVKFTDRLKTAAEFVGYLGGGYTVNHILRVDSFQLNDCEKMILASMTVFSFLAARFSFAERPIIKTLGFAFAILAFAVILIITLGFAHINLALTDYGHLILWAIPISAMAVILNFSRSSLLSSLPYRHWMLAVIFFFFPYIYAFGTNQNYWQAGGAAGLFWLLAGLALLVSNKKKWTVLLPFVLASQVIVVLLMQTSLENPYRQPQPLRLNNYPIDFGRPGSQLILSESYGTYVAKAVASAKRANFKAGTPIIDLSGQSPGILYALRAKNIGQAWTLGGSPGTEKLAIESLKKVSCQELGQAWLLVEPDGPRSLSANPVLKSIGANPLADYQAAGSWYTATGVGGYKEARRQILKRPLRQPAKAAQACAYLRRLPVQESDN